MSYRIYYLNVNQVWQSVLCSILQKLYCYLIYYRGGIVLKVEDMVFKCNSLQHELLKAYVGSDADFTDKCIHCNRSIYLDYEKLMETTGRFGISKGYSIEEASSKLIQKCPHCGKCYRGIVVEIPKMDVVGDIKELLKGIKYGYLCGQWYEGVDTALDKYNLMLEEDFEVVEKG